MQEGILIGTVPFVTRRGQPSALATLAVLTQEQRPQIRVEPVEPADSVTSTPVPRNAISASKLQAIFQGGKFS